MTVTADVNALTGNSFNPTLVTAALVIAEKLITGEIVGSYSAGVSTVLDNAVTILTKEILERGRDSNKDKTDKTNTYSSASLITPEIRQILDEYNSSSLIISSQISLSASDRWRS